MSVPLPQRNSGELEVNVLTKQMCLHTLRVLENEKIFPAKQEFLINMIRTTAIDIYTTCWEANNIRVNKSMKLYGDRLALELHAGQACNDLYALIELAKPLFHLNGRKAAYWQSLVTKSRNKIRAWYESDAKRLKPNEG